MVMTYAKSLAQIHTNEKVSDCVITVPGFYRQFERQAILDAAHIAGLKVLSLMNDHTALALKYGIDHNVASLTEPENVLFYDMGSTSTRASVVQFSAIPDKEAFQKNKTLGQLKVLSTSWDETLGGAAFTQIVADMLEKQSKQPIAGNKRALAKLLQTAEKAKIVLSANKEAHPSIESFIGVSMWGADKKAWCCRVHHVGCPPTAPPVVVVPVTPCMTPPPAPADPYNCEDGFANWQAGWSVGKKAWCCKVHSKGCPQVGGCVTTSPPYDCNAGFANWQAGWSVAKKAWCCQHGGKGCPPAAGGC